MQYSKPDRECDLILHDEDYEYKIWLVNYISENQATFVYVSTGFDTENELSVMKIENEDIHYRHNNQADYQTWSFDVDGEEAYLDFLIAMQMLIQNIDKTLLGE